jgi:2-phospho-L-lactate guanylyltransferase
LPVFVVSSNTDVETFARVHQTGFIRDDGAGLNAAVASGVAALAHQGFTHVAIVHGDLPCAASLSALLPRTLLTERDVIIVPDRHHDGTNVLVINAHRPIRFRYGVGSFTKHCIEATQQSRRVTVVHNDDWSLDIDTPDDLAEWQRRQSAP